MMGGQFARPLFLELLMKKDDRICQMAKMIIKHSIKIKKGELIYIEANGKDTLCLMEEVIKEATKAGAVPFYYFNDDELIKSFLESASEAQIKKHTQLHADIMKKADAYVAIRGSDNIFAMSDLSDKKMAMYNSIYAQMVHFEQRIPHTRWCVMRYPNDTMASLSKMSTSQFEDFYFNACLTDYNKMEKAQKPLVKLMKKTNKVRIIAPDTNIEFSIKGINVLQSCGHNNLPDGEVFTAPVKNSINGHIRFNTQAIEDGVVFSNIYLEFKDGKIIKATSDVNNDKLQKIINLDAGASYMGEFALGHNPYINHAMLDTLFDEKIAGSLHMAIGNSYDDACNTNKSCVHWDLVQIQTPEYGGGEIWFDDVLIRKDGRFVIKELEVLNPENLV